MNDLRRWTAAFLLLALALAPARARSTFGTGCPGASGVTPQVSVPGVVAAGAGWTLDVVAPGGIGLGYLLVGFSNTSSAVLGGAPLPLHLRTFFADPLWTGCFLAVDPGYAIVPYAFDPGANGGRVTFNFPGFSGGSVFVQAVNVDPDFVTRVAGVSQGLEVRPAVPMAGMVPIQPGTFLMGSAAPAGSPYFGIPAEQPVHDVTIGHPFWMGRHEVTQAEYQQVVGSNPSVHVGANRPVDTVSWFDARAYCQSLTAIESAAGHVPPGYEYRLPTEAEWEYACRAGTTTEFSVGATLECADARFWLSYHSGATCGSTGTVDVGSYPPNAFGLYDVHGNVREWCLDSLAAYPSIAVTDPFASGGPARILRGGSWNAYSSDCRSAARFWYAPGTAFDSIGFRVVLAPVLVP